ncbi:hypothetical protein SNEBB_010574 [Seison nebaliae]|nr:hypothetical protein SNEBB_010574 [Seison nebaliae]
MVKLLLVIIYIISLAVGNFATPKVCEKYPKFEKNDKTIRTGFIMMFESVEGKYLPGDGSVYKFHCEPGYKFKQTDDEYIKYVCKGATEEWTSDSVGTDRRMDCIPA